MKMRTLKSIACAAVMALALSATACGGSDDAAKTEDNAPVESTDEAGGEAEPEAPAADDNADAAADNADAEPDAAADDAQAESDAETSADSADAATGTFATLEEYYNDPSVKSVLDSAFEGLAQEGMALSIEVKGNVFTMTCKFTDSSAMVEGVDEALKQGLEAAASQFETQAAAFDEAVGESGACTVVVRYTDPDDKVLAEGEYKAK